MTRQRSPASSINSWVSAPEDGDDITGYGDAETKAAASHEEIIAFARTRANSFLGKEQQKQQNLARKHEHPKPRFDGDMIVQFCENTTA